MKKIIILVRKMIFIILKLVRFPKLNKKIKYNLEEVEKKYANKELKNVNNELKIDNTINLTVIIPVYNTEKMLVKCIESLISQKTKYKYNIICINDGSTDNSLEILKKYEKEQLNINVINQTNKGIAETRNIGIKNIVGEYVAFIDSDDFVRNDYIEKLLNCAYKNGSDIVRCGYYEYNIENQSIIKESENLDNKNIIGNIGKDILTYKGYPWGGVFKSELWSNIQFPEGYWYEDMVIRLILFRKSKAFSYINDKLYYYCLHSNNISKAIEKTSDIRCLDQYYLVKQLVKISYDIGLKTDEALYYDIMYEYSVVLWLRTRKLDKQLRKEIFRDACKFINLINYNHNYNKEELILRNIFKKYDYVKWKLFAIYKMLGVKYGIK